MGLLDDLLGSALGGALGGGTGGGRAAGPGGADLGAMGAGAGGAGAAMLMQIVAALLASRGGAGTGGGGLGGLAGLAEQFQRGGLGDVMNSWIGTGPNREISPDQLGGVLGSDLVGEMMQRTGMGQGDLLGQLSQVLPQMVDRATPEGRIPEGGLGDIGAILARLDRGTGH